MGRKYTNEWYKRTKEYYDASLRQQRINRIRHLIDRAMAEHAAGGYRGGVAADSIRVQYVAEWRAELAELTPENH